MCLIREAYDISTVVYKTDFIVLTVAELLNGADIETTAFACSEFFTENLATGNDSYFTKVQEFLTLGKEFCTLLLQFLSVNDHNDSRRTDFRHVGTTQCELTGKECHSVSLTATGSTEICTTLTTLGSYGFYDTLLEQSRCKELRITADDFFFITVVFVVLEINIITEDFKESCRCIHAFYHRVKLVKR